MFYLFVKQLKLTIDLMKVLVTGGAGFIGSHLIDELSKENDVVVLDNFSNSLREPLNFTKKDNIKLIEGDIVDFELVKSIVKDVDYVFHLAAHLGVEKSVKEPLLNLATNVIGTFNILKACLNSEIKK